MDDNSVIKKVLSGNRRCFEELIKKYENRVFRFALNLINDSHLCEDVAQDVFFTAYKKLLSFDPARSSFSTWLFTITRNKSINVLKKKKPTHLSEMPDTAYNNNPEKILEHNELMRLLDSALDRLPLKLKTAFILAEMEGLPYVEIARIEKTKLGTIKSRISRAKDRLKKILAPRGGSS